MGTVHEKLRYVIRKHNLNTGACTRLTTTYSDDLVTILYRLKDLPYEKGIVYDIYDTINKKVAIDENQDNPICPYCNQRSVWVDNSEIYGRRFGLSYMAYWCKDCDAYVGCHNNSRIPLGTLANKTLRTARSFAHAKFDPFWKACGMTRSEAYELLADYFGRPIHIGESDLKTCNEIIEFVNLVD